MITNFDDVLLLDGKTTRFLRFINNETEPIYVFCNVTFYETSGSPKSDIKINGCPLDELTPEMSLRIGKGNEAAVRIDYDGLSNTSAVIEFYEFKDGSPATILEGSPIKPKKLIIYGFAKEDSGSHIDINNFQLQKNINYDQKTSYLLMRTNPALTGNVKLTIDSNNELSLNSINANDYLADSDFKHYNISYISNYQTDISRFSKKMSNVDNTLFFFHTDESPIAAKVNYNEERKDLYSYGVSQCNSKLYNEEFSLFAPIWLTKKIPEYFVIFRAKHPITKESYISNKSNKIFAELINDSEIIKTFDLRENSKLGVYIRNITNDPNFTDNPISVNFGAKANNDSLVLHGISIEDNIIASKNVNSFSLKSDMTIKDFESEIIGSFEDQGIIACNILNLEFLFDDTEADEYSINRYFGLYLDAIELGECEFSNELLSRISEDIQYPQSVVGDTTEPYSIIPFTQYNDKGIILPIPQKALLPSGDDFCNDTRIFAIKDRDNKFHRIKESIERFDYLDGINYYDFRLYDTKLDITKMCGIYNVKFSGPAKLNSVTHAQMQLSLYENGTNYIFAPGDRLSIVLKNNGSVIDTFTMIANETDINKGDCWKFPVYDASESCMKGMFNPTGDRYIVAQAIARCINQFNSLYFRAINIKNNVIIICCKEGESGNSFVMERKVTIESFRNNCKFFDSATCDSLSFCGGNETVNNIAIITKEQANSLQDDIYFQVKSGRFSKIKNFGSKENPIFSIPDVSNAVFDGYDIVDIPDYGENRIVSIEKEWPFYTNAENYIVAFDIYKPTVSIMSMYPIKDFDFDFYSSDYAYYRQDELESIFKPIKLNSKGDKAILDKNEVYYVSGKDVKVRIKDAYFEDGEYRDANYTDGDGIETYSILNREVELVEGKATLIKYNYNYSNTDEDEDAVLLNEVSKFNGFVGLTDGEVADSNAYKSNSIERFSTGKLDNEYERLKENSMSKYAFNSKVVPTYIKWVNSGTDVRDNQYRLNFSSAFGTTNFSPLFGNEYSNSVDNFTYEWPYLAEYPKNFNVEYAAKTKSYMNGLLSDSVGRGTYYTIEHLLLDTNIDYFTKFFIKGYNHTNYKDSKDILNERYTFCNYINSTSATQTIFHGIKIKIEEKDKDGKIDNRLRDYNDYKFSVILSRLEDKSEAPYEFKIYDNKKFKTMLFVIKIPLQGDSFKNGMSYTDLYNSTSFYDFSNLKIGKTEDSYITNIKYADTRQYSVSPKTIKYVPYSEGKIYYMNVLETKYGINFDEIQNVRTSVSTGCPSFAWLNGDMSGFFLNHSNTNINTDSADSFIFGDKEGYEYLLDDISVMHSKYGFATSVASEIWNPIMIKLEGGQNANFNNSIVSINSIKNIIDTHRYEYVSNDYSYTPEISFIEPVKYEKNNVLKNDEKYNISTGTKIEKIADYDVTKTNDTETLQRYPGSYKPKFKNVVEFAADAPRSICEKFKKDFLLCNTDILIDSDSFEIKNFSYNKVGEYSIQKDNIYSQGTLYNLVAINECSIDKKDISIAKTNWDNAYYSEYSSSKSFKLIPGTSDVKEIKSFFGSKAMNVPMSFDFYSYNDDEFTLEEFKNTEANTKQTNNTNSQVNGSDYTIIKFNVAKILFNRMLEEGLMNEINWAIENVKTNFSSISEYQREKYMERYYEENIKNLYHTIKVNVYAKNAPQDNATFMSKYDGSKLIYQGYTLYNNAKYELSDDLNFSLQINQEKAKYYSYVVHIEVERI